MKTHQCNFKLGLLIVTILVKSLFSAGISKAQGWFNNDWQFRSPITASNPGSTNLTDFQVKITLDNIFDFSKVEDNGSDLIFTEDNGITPIPHWIENWDAINETATIWVKVPEIPVLGTTIYMYYGNSDAPGSLWVESPPSGPFTNDPVNIIIPSGDPGNGDTLLAEQMVSDDVSGRYWLPFSSLRSGEYQIGLAWSDDPTNPDAWNWDGIKMYNAFSPHLIEYDNIWYLFYSDRSLGSPYPISVATSSFVNGPFTFLQTILQPSVSWEGLRLDQPHVFHRNDGKWVMMYMGDLGLTAGNPTEHSGYATADNITGPYTKYAGNPVLDFGPSGSYDWGGAGNPWVYEFEGVYYIGYTVTHELPTTTTTPWRTGWVTTTDWVTFNKQGYLLTGANEFNCFRGAVTRINNTYVLPYTTKSSSTAPYRMAIATQPAYLNIINNAEAVFDFYDGFDGNSLDRSKWSIRNGTISQTSVESGLLTMTASSIWIRIDGRQWCGMDYIQETRGTHPNQGTLNMTAEVGFADYAWNTCRIVDDILNPPDYWQRQAKLAGPINIIENMNVLADPNWHIFRVYRESPNIAGFQIDGHPVETVEIDVPTMDLPPFLMSYGNTNQFHIDWTRVRKWSGADIQTSVGDEQYQDIKILSLTIYLEGTFNGTNMNADLSDLAILPLTQPYNITPWNYSGAEALTELPNPNVVDWVLVELRDAPDASSATTASRVAQQAALLLNDGRIVGLDGISNIQFNTPIIHQIFVIIWHRNHLGIMSANAIIQTPENLYSYDFSTSASQAFGEGQNYLGNEIYGMIGGDANADGIINLSDAIQSWIPQAGSTGYLSGDFDMDGQVNNPDKNEWWLDNLNRETHVPE